jgi:hypothetical protein
LLLANGFKGSSAISGNIEGTRGSLSQLMNDHKTWETLQASLWTFALIHRQNCMQIEFWAAEELNL